MKVFEKRSVISTSVERMIAFHEDPRALSWLTMPPVFMQVLRDDRISLTAGEIAFRIWVGPIRVRWVARHEPGPIDTSFIDCMIDGPMAYWEHQHIFKPTAGGVELLDHVTFAHKPGWRGLATRLLFDGFPLRILFMYRHWRTRRMLLSNHANF